jgi:excisionase family DNA binding protein
MLMTKRQSQTAPDGPGFALVPTPGADDGQELNRAGRRHDEAWLANRLAVSPGEAAECMGVGRDLIYKLLHDGTLRSVKMGSRTLIPTSSLRALLEEAGS